MFDKAIRHIGRQGAPAPKRSEADTAVIVTVASGRPVEINEGALWKGRCPHCAPRPGKRMTARLTPNPKRKF